MFSEIVMFERLTHLLKQESPNCVTLEDIVTLERFINLSKEEDEIPLTQSPIIASVIVDESYPLGFVWFVPKVPFPSHSTLYDVPSLYSA